MSVSRSITTCSSATRTPIGRRTAPLIRDWSQRLAASPAGLLASALNPTVDDGSRFDMFLDDRSLQAGDDLTAKLRQQAERSAILLVLMSPLYPKKSWCLDELHWFLDQAAKDGRGREHCVPLRIQPLPDAALARPAQGRARRAAGLSRLRRHRDRAAAGDLDAPPAKDLVRKAQIQIKGKLEELRRRWRRAGRATRSRRSHRSARSLYLHAQPDDARHGTRRSSELDEAGRRLPAELPARRRTIRSCSVSARRRLKELRDCAALLLLRARDGADTSASS